MKLPISVKAVLLDAGRVLLLKNDRDEWELPGSRLESGETPEECVQREVEEETGLNIKAGSAVSSWVYEVLPGKRVFVVAYRCYAGTFSAIRISDEHEDMEFVQLGMLEEIPLPEGYRKAIMRAESH